MNIPKIYNRNLQLVKEQYDSEEETAYEFRAKEVGRGIECIKSAPTKSLDLDPEMTLDDWIVIQEKPDIHRIIFNIETELSYLKQLLTGKE